MNTNKRTLPFLVIIVFVSLMILIKTTSGDIGESELWRIVAASVGFGGLAVLAIAITYLKLKRNR